MESYLREIYQRLIAIGAQPATARRGVEIARQWIETEIRNGVSEARAIHMHRTQQLPDLLAGARNIERTTRLLGSRTPPPPVTRPKPQPDPEEILREFVEHLRDMEAERTIIEIQRDYPGGGIATPRDVAVGTSMARFLDLYGPAATFLIRIMPIVGDVTDLAEAALGRDLFSGATLSSSDRALRTAFGIVGLITLAGRIAVGLSRGVTSVIRSVATAADRIGTTADALRLSFSGFARFARYRSAITRALAKLQNAVVMSSDEIRLLRLFVERLLEHVRLARSALLEAVEASGRVLRRLTSRSGAAIRVVNQSGGLKFWRCAGS